MNKALDSGRGRRGLPSLDARLAAYMAAGVGGAAALAGESEAAIVANTTQQPIGINGEVNIDYNSDGQIDFQIDHDRVNLNGNNLDYLQVDKSDANSAADPLPFPPLFDTFPVNGTTANDDRGVMSFNNPDPAMNSGGNGLGGYVVALKAGDVIGDAPPTDAIWDYQEGDNINGSGSWVRANRLIDEDATKIDQALGGRTPGVGAGTVYLPYKPDPPSATLDDWNGLNGETRYIGTRIKLNSDPAGFTYGWIGVKIDNEADATGVVTGWAYESTPGTSIIAGDTGPAAPGDYNRNGKVDGEDFLVWQQQFGSTVAAGTGADGNNDTLVNALDFGIWKGAFGTATGAGSAVPEPASLASALIGGGLICGAWLRKRLRGRAQA